MIGASKKVIFTLPVPTGSAMDPITGYVLISEMGSKEVYITDTVSDMFLTGPEVEALAKIVAEAA